MACAITNVLVLMFSKLYHISIEQGIERSVKL